MIRKNFLLLISFLTLNIYVQAADTISGNASTSSETFSFPIKAHAFDQTTGIFFAGANPSQNGLTLANNFALTQLKRTSTAFDPLAPKTATVNGKAIDNPLFDAGVEFLSLISGPLTMGHGRPLVVKTGELSTLYLIDSFYDIKNIAMVKEENVRDATGSVTDGIVGLTGSTVSFAFAAVLPAGGGSFGSAGSGIAEFILGVKNESKQRLFGQLDAPTGAMSTTPKAVPLNVTSDQVKITSDVASIGQVVSMHWDPSIGRLFIGLQVTAGAGGTDGARAVVVGRIGKNKELILSPIAPDAALAGTDKIIGATGSGVQVSANQIKSMFTSTASHYLIVQGGNGAPAATRRTIFALPLVSGSTDAALNGTIADKLTEPVDTYESKIPFRFLRRDVKEPATTAAGMTLDTDPAAMVGCGELAAGDIDEVFVRSDAVFAVVGTPADADQKPGIFTSQALFDETGKIKGWTQWRRVAGTTAKTYGTALDAYQGNFTFMIGTDIDNTATVQRTRWGNGSNSLRSLSEIISNDFTQDEGGAHRLFDFSQTTSGLEDISLLAVTGLEKVLLAESGQAMNNVLCPFTGNYINTLEIFDNGTITKTFPNGAGDPKAIQISGGVLDTVGPIIAAEIATNGAGGAQGYLFVGGAGGLAVLSKSNGDGWTTGLGPDFEGITAGMSFKLVGSYSFVRKLIFDDDYLYVLTNNKLDRINLTAAGVGLGNVTPVTVADLTLVAGRPNASFLDCIVSEKFALLATSFGLLRVGNGNDIRTATGPTVVGWCPVPNPEWPNNAQQIVAVSKTGRAQDVARNDGGHIYVLNAYRGKQRSQINRFAIEPVEGFAIDDDTIKPIPDIFVQDRLSYLMNYGQLRVMFTTDGAMYFGARDRNLTIDPQVIVPSTATPPRSGFRFVGVKGANKLPLSISGGNNVTTLLRDFASGSWLISGDFGLQVNQ